MYMQMKRIEDTSLILTMKGTNQGLITMITGASENAIMIRILIKENISVRIVEGYGGLIDHEILPDFVLSKRDFLRQDASIGKAEVSRRGYDVSKPNLHQSSLSFEQRIMINFNTAEDQLD